MYNAQYFIEKLEMQKHVEGGFYKESIRSGENIITSDRGERDLWSSIYFLLQTGEVSHFHRLKSDEVWYYHSGNALTIYMITPEGELIRKSLGLELEKGQLPQIVVPKGYIFGSAMEAEGFSLVGCMVAPSFTFDDFELFDREDLLTQYPSHFEIINKLTRE
ncbi:MAG: cupin domain-containing protein [Cellulosilyticaceae bacterium]